MSSDRKYLYVLLYTVAMCANSLLLLLPLKSPPHSTMEICIIIIRIFLIPSGVKIPRVKSKVKSKQKAEVVTPRR